MKNNKPESVDEYISQLEGEGKARIKTIREAILEKYPSVTESIRYNMPAYNLHKTHLYFAAYKQHIGMYPVSHIDGLTEEIAPYRGKGTKDSLHFLHKEPLPLKLIMKIVTTQFRARG
jgi:uncharacterized protein YdhG (YjbR/CyaY superfamily)